MGTLVRSFVVQGVLVVKTASLSGQLVVAQATFCCGVSKQAYKFCHLADLYSCVLRSPVDEKPHDYSSFLHPNYLNHFVFSHITTRAVSHTTSHQKQQVYRMR